MKTTDKELYERTIKTLQQKISEMDNDIQILIEAQN